MKKENGVNKQYTQEKTISVQLTKYDLLNILTWYRILHHSSMGRLCRTPVKFCHKTRDKILNASKRLGPRLKKDGNK